MDDYLFVGTIVGTHALKGEVKIASTTDFKEERYKKGNTLYIKKNETLIPVKVKNYRPHKEYDLVSFEGYLDIDAVLHFKQCKIYVDKSQLNELEEDEFYYHELVDCQVFHESRLIGIVKDVVNYGASDLIIVKDGEKEHMIPFVDEFIVDVDTKNKKVQINVIEGLLGESK